MSKRMPAWEQVVRSYGLINRASGDERYRFVFTPKHEALLNQLLADVRRSRVNYSCFDVPEGRVLIIKKRK